MITERDKLDEMENNIRSEMKEMKERMDTLEANKDEG